MTRDWQEVIFAENLPMCVFCEEEPHCPEHQTHFADCPCPGPMQDEEYEYEERAGVLYARRRLFPLPEE